MSRQQKAERSTSTVLVEMARERYEFGISTLGEVFAVPVFGEPVVRPLRGAGGGLRTGLASLYFDEHGRAPGQQALTDALNVLDGGARLETPVELYQRVAQTKDAWWVDLGDHSGEAIKVNRAGWTIELPPVRFRRTVLTGRLPRPVRGGDIGELWECLNVAESDRPLVLAWLVAALNDRIPHPILALLGQQGSGKSTAAKIISSLIDPSPAPLRKPPRDADSWITAASGSWVVTLDNVSTISDWLSDTLCRAVSGEGDVRRQLYTDGELSVFAFRRAVVVTGIDPGAVCGDLADRLLTVNLDVIDDRRRFLDEEVADRWRSAHGPVLGALLDLTARVAAVLPDIRLETAPRMADFARVLTAVDHVVRTDGLRRYIAGESHLAAESLTADRFITAMATQLRGTFTGTAAELLEIVSHGDLRAPRGWPQNPRVTTALLRRQAPVMRKAGWCIDSCEDKHKRVTVWSIIPPKEDPARFPQVTLTPSPNSGDPFREAGIGVTPETAAAGVAGHAGNEYWPSLRDRYGASSETPDADRHRTSPRSGLVTRVQEQLPPPIDVLPEELGRCGNCGGPVRRYGESGRPLCNNCLEHQADKRKA